MHRMHAGCKHVRKIVCACVFIAVGENGCMYICWKCALARFKGGSLWESPCRTLSLIPGRIVFDLTLKRAM